MNAVTQAPRLPPITTFKGEWEFLSNFYRATITLGELTGPTSEHVFQAVKTHDNHARAEILAAPTPRDAKALGRRAPLRPDWEQLKKQYMLRIVMAKFTQHPDLAAQLAATGDRPLVEGNMWHDHYWGHCYCQGRKCQGEGLNYLGQILMAARLVLRDD